ncbi:amidohydrolase family protein [Umezawaea beigongshangensis]|uniref:amidohydrolase family protein n=1 Tax=Umezawaea beigongshangensis TaxID=2780383 RepID=UPI0018F200C9|nr:amidohydrolase family protein [Umezawaea beigongshangensis]
MRRCPLSSWRRDISRFTITDVHPLAADGTFGPLTSVAVEDGVIVDRPGGAEVDGRGGYLLPGLIDTHVHVDHPDQLVAALRWGVTTVLDMGTPRWDGLRALRDADDDARADLRGVSSPACAPRGTAVRKMNHPASTAVRGPGDAARWIAERLDQDPDYVKIVLEEKLPFQPKPLAPDTVAALVAHAHRAGKKVVVHAASSRAYAIALDAGADVITHAPVRDTLSADLARRVTASGTAVSPTLVMMRTILRTLKLPFTPKSLNFGQTLASTGALHRAGATIVLGTDANADDTSPARVAHGSSAHEELALLVHAGLSPSEALSAATSRAAAVFGLDDRGVIAPGKRADLLLVARDPARDITATRDVVGVWKRGVAAPVPRASPTTT